MEAATAGETITTRIPAPHGPAAVEPLALARRPRPGHRVGARRRSRSRSSARSRAACRTSPRRSASAPSRSACGGTGYIIGAVIGALGLRLSDRPARAQEALHRHARRLPRRPRSRRPSRGASRPSRSSACSPALGIGGEYAAINSAIDELIPRGCAAGSTSRSTAPTGSAPALGARADLRAARPAASSRIDLGWRLAFGLGAVLGLAIMLRAPARAREPALADDPRPRATRPSGSSARSRSASSATRRARARRSRRRPSRSEPRKARQLRDRAHALQALSAAPVLGFALMVRRRSSTTRSSSPSRSS